MSQSYRPSYHASVRSGWCNDPNGTIFFNGKAHLFYQHYPYKPEWGTMHWGHWTTGDFVHWEEQPLTLAPDQDYEVICGCCSGSTIEKDGKLYLMYTAAQPELQRQCMAVSEDGVHFVKDPGNPILTADMLDPEVSMLDFRDPRMFQKGDWYYFIAGVRIIDPKHPPADASGASAQAPDVRKSVSEDLVYHAAHVSEGAVHHSSSGGAQAPVSNPSSAAKDKGYGNLILARSKDLYHWEYVGKLFYPRPEFSEEYYRLDGVYECPDYFALDGAEVLLSSPQNLPRMGNRYQNIHSALYMLGKLDFDTGRFDIDVIGEVDSGFDFYASQTLRMPDGRVILIAWKEMWDRGYPTQKEGWAGTYSLPRELRVKDGFLIQQPVREIEAYRRNRVSRESLSVDGKAVSVPGISGNKIELSFTLEAGTAEKAGVKLFRGTEHETLLYYDRAAGVVAVDRANGGLFIKSREEEDPTRRFVDVGDKESMDFRVFLDVCTMEAFIDGGKYAMTANVYPDPEDVGVEFFSEGGAATFRNLEKYDIVA